MKEKVKGEVRNGESV